MKNKTLTQNIKDMIENKNDSVDFMNAMLTSTTEELLEAEAIFKEMELSKKKLQKVQEELFSRGKIAKPYRKQSNNFKKEWDEMRMLFGKSERFKIEWNDMLRLFGKGVAVNEPMR